MTLLNFNAATVAPDMGMEALPAGWYHALIDQSEMKPTKDAATTGNAYLEIRFSIMDGQYAGRKVFVRLNLKNNNPQAQEIAYKQLSAICHAVQVIQVNDSQELHGKPLKIKVKMRPADGQYEASNDITMYKGINEPVDAPAGATSVSTFAQAQQPAAPQGFPAQPWAGQAAPQMAPQGVPPTGFPSFPQTPAAAAPVVAAPAPVALPTPPAAAPVAPAPVLAPVKTMTAKANGATYEAFISQGWNDQQMVEQGYLTITQPQQPAAAVLPPAAAPVAPQMPAAPTNPAVVASAGLQPPWAQQR